MDASMSSVVAKHVGSAEGLDEPCDLTRLRHAAGLALGKHESAIDQDGELSKAAPGDPDGHSEGRLQLVPEAYRLPPQIESDCAALDLDVQYGRL
jgi:hypothetical protein